MKNRYKLILIALVFVIGLILRVAYLSKYPVSLTIDEVAVGYNSYSLLKTGMDEHGKFLPLLFRSIGDYKSPLLIYLNVPATALLGLNEFSTRITIALVGALTIPLVFYLSKLLTNNYLISLAAAFSLSISPWHIKPSRITHDAVLGLFLIILGVLSFMHFIKKSRITYLIISATAFSLSMYAYHAEKIFTPLLVLSLLLIYKDQLLKHRLKVLAFIVTLVIITMPLLIISLRPEGRTRANMTFITQDNEINSELKSNLSFNLLDNNLLSVSNFWFKRYLDYFDLRFLFTRGMAFTLPNSPDIGLLYLFELPLFLFGLYYLVFKNRLIDSRNRLLIFSWLILGPIPASLANNTQHTLRSLTIIPSIQIIIGFGLFHILSLIKNKFLLRRLFIGLALLSVIYSICYFLTLYFINYQTTHSEAFMDGWKGAAFYSIENQQLYKEIVIDPRFGTQGPFIVGTPYLYLLYYGEINPRQYQLSPRRVAKDSSDFDNFTFRQIDWSESPGSDRFKKETLFIGSPWVLPIKDDESNGKILKRFYLYNGKGILRAVSL